MNLERDPTISYKRTLSALECILGGGPNKIYTELEKYFFAIAGTNDKILVIFIDIIFIEFRILDL